MMVKYGGWGLLVFLEPLSKISGGFPYMSPPTKLILFKRKSLTTEKTIATTTCVKRQLMFPTEDIAKKLKCTNTNEKYSSENDCTLAHQQLNVHSGQSHISPVASKCIQPKACGCKGLLHNCGISSVKTVKQCLPLTGF